MSKQNERRLQAAKDAITKLFEDRSVTVGVARSNLKELQEYIDELLEAIRD